MMHSEFTGRKMAAVMVGGFALVIAVNLTMASFASRTFSGVVVENSYVASQKFNGWLEAAHEQEALGWQARVSRSGERLVLDTLGVPQGAQVTALLRRPLGQPDSRTLAFDGEGPGRLVSREPLPGGRWIVRLTIEADGKRWSSEQEIG